MDGAFPFVLRCEDVLTRLIVASCPVQLLRVNLVCDRSLGERLLGKTDAVNLLWSPYPVKRDRSSMACKRLPGRWVMRAHRGVQGSQPEGEARCVASRVPRQTQPANGPDIRPHPRWDAWWLDAAEVSRTKRYVIINKP